MGNAGNPHPRFLRAVSTANPNIVVAAAAELHWLSLADALRVLLVLVHADDARAERAAVRWAARWCSEVRPSAGAYEAQLALAAACALTGRRAKVAAETLYGLSEARGLREVCRVLDESAPRE